MFQRIKTFFRENRIQVDFPSYEAAKLQAHIAEANRCYDAGQLEKEVADIVKKCCSAANEKFSWQRSAIEQEIYPIRNKIQGKRSTLAFFERDYKNELNKLYEQKRFHLEEKTVLINEMKVLQKERLTAKESLNDAFDRLESAKDDIDSWYGKSERNQLFFGNGGKKLPNHSIFGQSFGDLEGYKDERDEAFSDIKNSKHELSSINDKKSVNKRLLEQNKGSLNKVFEQIDATKTARQHMFDLKQQGVKYQVVKKELSDLLTRLSALNSRLNQLQSEWSVFIKQMEIRMGIDERKTIITEIKARKARFLDEFHTPQNIEARRVVHREKWLFEHGIKPNE